jgi:hypothetical protein
VRRREPRRLHARLRERGGEGGGSTPPRHAPAARPHLPELRSLE